jgi:predicted RNA-binding Zn-ribbon protein involved in translation (DUF1610 family)
MLEFGGYMAYNCPQCGEKVSRGYNASAQMAAGLVGALLSAAFGAFTCPKCGKIPFSSFPAEDQKKMVSGSILLVVIAVAIGIACFALLANA